jgi:PKD repeat protein
MKKIKFIILTIVSFNLSLLNAQVDKSNKSNVSSLVESTHIMKHNHIATSMINDGTFIDYNSTDLNNAGMQIRKNDGDISVGVGTVFTSSFWVSSKLGNDTLVGVIGDWTQDMRPGTYGSDINDVNNRVYTVNVDMLDFPENHSDFQNWPVDQGAPWVDVDGDGAYSPLPNGPDHPKFYGDSVAYYVSADDIQAYKSNIGSDPTNLEFQFTVYSFYRPELVPLLNNTVFYRVKLINKGTSSLTETYTGIWHDADLGYAGDDLVGVDVDRSMGYVWNDGADSQISGFFDGQNLAQGIDLFQGPMVDCTANDFIDINLRGSDANGDNLAYNIRSGPSNGTASFISQNVVRYTPNAGFSGNDSFEYDASDGSEQSNLATVTVTVTDAGGSNLPKITSPNGGENWSHGEAKIISWNNGFSNTGIELYKGATRVKIISGDAGSVSNYNWTIPSDLTPGSDYRIRIYDAGAGEDEDYSDAYFTISNSSGKVPQSHTLLTELHNLSLENQQQLISVMQTLDLSSKKDINGFIRCGIDELEAELQQISPEVIAKRQQFYQQVAIKKRSIDFSNTDTIKIPMIFHVLYSNSSENISAAQIGENFDQLNLDFQTTNPDTSKVPKQANPIDATIDPNIDYSHYSVIGTHNVEFTGYQGETSGSSLEEGTTIRRYQMSQSTVSGRDEARSLVDSLTPDNGAVGGYQEGYFNVYIAPLSGGLLGQADFDVPQTVIATGTVGSLDSPGTLAPYNLGRTLTHEVGHNFSFYHIFQPSSCSDDPIMADIPIQISSNGTAAQLYQMENNTVAWYAGGANNSCIDNTDKGDQFMNYMDYSADKDLVMFSNEQAKQGYAWAASYNWAVNQTPSAESFSVSVTVNESCGIGAQMFGEIHPGKKNLELSSFNFFINGDATYSESLENIDTARNYMLGLRKDGSPYPAELAGDLYNQKFTFYGDPNDPGGHSTSNPVDGNYAASADRRFLMSVGPFNMAPGDSQEVVFSIIHEFGGDALSAIDNLKDTNSSLQNNYDDNFSILKYSGTASASITSSVLSGYAPLRVSFDGSNSSPTENFYWDFDNDGVTDSNSESPIYTFNAPGTYDVVLDVKYRDFVNGYSTLSVVSDTVSVNVLSPNPTVSNQSYTLNEDTSMTITLEGVDPQNQSLTFTIEENPENAIVSLSGSNLTFTPNTNFYGEETVKYSASNGSQTSNIGTITFVVNPVGDDPTTFDVQATTDEDTAVEVNLSAEEYDGDSFSFSIIQDPLHGSLGTVNGSVVIYTPDSNWFGVDNFTYEATDDRTARINYATASITVNPVNDAPTTNDMQIDTYEDQVTTLTLDVNDIDGDNLTVANTNPSHGTISAKAGNLFTYTPNENYNGSDSFTYVVNDGLLDSNTSTVSINLSPVNDASSDFTVSENYVLNSIEGEQETITTNYLMVTPENEQDSIKFVWNESIDIDGDQVLYRMIGFDGLEFLTMNDWTTDLSLSWSLSDLIAQTDTVNVASGSWLIQATDGEFFKNSNFGEPTLFSINGSALIPEEFILSQNYPNPFSSSTIIQYELPESQKVVIKIYDVRGRLIKVIVDEEQNAGFKNANWDGTNEDGDQVSSGVYFYQIITKKINKTRKMLLIR